MACDICGANDKPLVDLLDGYKTSDIKQVCHVCEKLINKQLSKIRVMTHNILTSLLKRFMATMKERRLQ